MDEKSMQTIAAKLDSIIKLMVFAITEGKSQTEQIRLLSAVGLQPKEIAEAVGTTSNTVRVALSNLRKQGGKGLKGKGRSEK
jgi:DNA-directed RNA polymerase specialized sigma24 family protein